ncbi:MAG: hypothetical protein ABJD97_09995 [Betaproteobacteria bacterium]
MQRVLAAFFLAVLSGLACASEPTAQQARVDLILQEPVAADPSAQLYVAEALTAMDHREQADALERALVDLYIRRASGEPADPALTLGGLLQRSADTASLAPGSATAAAWGQAVNQGVRLRFLDAVAADQPPPADARAGTLEIAPGLWVPAERVGSMILFVQVHQQRPVPLLISRVRVQWLGEQLTCTPVQGPGSRQQDAPFACEGPSHVDKLPALARAIKDSPDRLLVGVVEAGEFDSRGATSAWTDALAAGHDAELKRLLARLAPCEMAREPARQCAPAAIATATPQADPVQPSLPSRSSWISALSRDQLATLASWFFGGLVACWFICGLLRSSSLLMEIVVHFVVTIVLAFATYWVCVIGWLLWAGKHQEQAILGVFVAVAIGSALAAGIVAGGGLHLLRRIFEWDQDRRG